MLSRSLATQRGGGSPAARGRGAARRGFSGTLTTGPVTATSSRSASPESSRSPNAGPNITPPQPNSKRSKQKAKAARSPEAGSSSTQPPPPSAPEADGNTLVAAEPQPPPPPLEAPKVAPSVAESVATTEVEVCNICAEPIDLYSLPPCGHRTCHVCALRLRALYKKKDCTYCKDPIASLIFTKSPTRTFDSFRLSDIPFKDARLAISFETQEAMDETLIILRYNCPDPSCDVACDGWKALKQHVRDTHKMILCEYCVRSKKIFAHEHTLYNHKTIKAHVDAEHGLCQFCNEHFYSEDELFVHMRDKHEQCHLCKARDPEQYRWQYHRDYRQLEQHFRESHFLCPAKECLADKFVVFDSKLDYNAHQMDKHGHELTSKERRDAMRVDAAFSYADGGGGPSARGGRAGGQGRGRGERGGRIGREGGAHTSSSADEAEAVAEAASRQERAQRPVPGAAPTPAHPPASRRRQFGGALTSTTGSAEQSAAENATSSSAPLEGTSAPGSRTDSDVVARHALYMQRVSALLDHSESKITSFRTAVRIYNASEMGARDLVLTIVALVGGVENASNPINGLADLLEQDDKKRDLLQAWNTIRVEKTHFPTLVPASAVAPAGGSDKRYASFASGHVMNVKHSSARSNHVWSNVERAAAASSGPSASGTASSSRPRDSFPALHANNASSVPGSAAHAHRAAAVARKAGSAVTPWATGLGGSSKTSSAAPSPRPYSVPATSAQSSNSARESAPKPASEALFPSLPVNASALALAQHKKAVLATTATHRARQNLASPPSSGAATPINASQSVPLSQWGAGGATADGGAGVGGKGKAKKKGVPLLSLGGVQRG